MRSEIRRTLAGLASLLLCTGLGIGCGRAMDGSGDAGAPLDAAGLAAMSAAVRAQQEGVPERVGPLLAPLLALDPPPADAQFVAGSAAYDLGRFGEAVERLEDAVRRKPEFLPAASALGFAWRRLGDYDKAVAAFGRIVAARPSAHKAHYGLGLVAIDRGDAAAARAHLERALALQPGYLKARFAMARVLIEEGRLQEAREALEWVTALWPAHEQALYHLAQVDAALGDEAGAEAVLVRREEVYRLTEEAGGLLVRRRSGDSDPQIAARLTELYLALGEGESARRELELGLAAAPESQLLLDLVPHVQAELRARPSDPGSPDD